MRGRRGLGGYTLGDRYTTPDRRLSQMLMRQGSRGGPSDSWQETLGRIAQQLSGAYIGKLDQDKQDIANQAFAKVQPDEYTMQPTYSPADTKEFLQQATGGISNELRFTDKAEAMLDTLQAPMLQGTAPSQIQEETFGPQGQRPEQPNIDGSGWNQMPDLSRVHEANTYANVPNPNPAQQTADLMASNRTETLNEKKPQLEYAMQNLRGLENNPYAQRLLQGLMMNKMSNDAASRLDATARERQLADAARTRGFAVEDAIRDRGYSVEDRDLLAQNKIDVKDAGLGTGPFQGTSPYAQNSNILLNGDPSTPVYRAAYNKMATSKNTLDPNTGQMVSVSPDMSAFRPPTGAPTNTAPQGQTPGQPSISVTEGQGRTKPYPEFQSKSAGFYNRMMDANSEIDNLFAGKDGKQGTPDDLKIEDVYNWREYASDNVPFIGNALTSDNFQRAQQAQRNWVSANLRLESGAAIPPEEMEMEFKKYFPSYGDGDAVIQQKARARKKVEQNMRTQSQGAYESMYGAGKNNPPSDTPQPPSGFKVVN